MITPRHPGQGGGGGKTAALEVEEEVEEGLVGVVEVGNEVVGLECEFGVV